MGGAGRHHLDPLARRELPVDDPDVGDDAAVDVVDRVEDHRARRGRRRRRPGPGPSRQIRSSSASTPWPVLALTRSTSSGSQPMMCAISAAYTLGLRGRQVDLVQHRDDVQVVLERQVEVGQRLRLDALRGVDQQDGALAGGQRAGHLVGEVDVARACRSCAARSSTPVVAATVHGIRTFCALMVMPRSRSMSIRSRYCARIWRASTTPVSCSMRSASVDLPWSMWAMMQKLRMIGRDRCDRATSAVRSRGCDPSDFRVPCVLRRFASHCADSSMVACRRRRARQSLAQLAASAASRAARPAARAVRPRPGPPRAARAANDPSSSARTRPGAAPRHRRCG